MLSEWLVRGFQLCLAAVASTMMIARHCNGYEWMHQGMVLYELCMDAPRHGAMCWYDVSGMDWLSYVDLQWWMYVVAFTACSFTDICMY